MTNGERAREEIRTVLRRLAASRANDGVKLAFQGEWTPEEIEGLDLTGVVELKRGSNGAFELRFVDPLRALEMLRDLEEDREEGAAAFFAALEGGSGER